MTPTQPSAQDPAVLVTGGAGFIGQHVVRLLADGGKTVVALYHHKLPEALDNVYPVGSDMGSAELLAAPLRGIETVIHMAWQGGLAGPQTRVNFDPSTPSVLPHNVQILKNLLTAMERAGTRRIVFLSASGARRGATVPFLQEKYLGEFFVLNSKIPEKVVIRSAVAFGGQGGGDRFLRSIMRVMKYPLYPVPKRQDASSSSLAPVHVRDLAATIVGASEHEMEEGGAILDLQGSEQYAVPDLFKIVSERCLKGTRIALPAFMGQSLLPFFERDRSEQQVPKIGHFLAIGTKVDDESRLANPIAGVVPKKLQSFKEAVLE